MINYDTFWKDNHCHNLHPSVRLRNDFIFSQLKHRQFWTLLDVGCGDGYFVNLMYSQFPDKQLSGTDISEYIISKNSTDFPAISFFYSDLWDKDFSPPQTFDVVVCSEVIEHISDWKQVIQNLAKFINEEGYCVLTTQSWKRYKSDLNIGHLKHFTLEELEDECKKYWLVPIVSYKKGFPFYNLQKWAYEKIENKAKDIQQWEAWISTRLLFSFVYHLFCLSPKSRTLWPQIFMVLQKNS